MSQEEIVKRVYTLCFCKRGDLILMLRRKKKPNQNLWNGLGGKVEVLEVPLQAVRREILEEGEIDITSAEVYYGGIVSDFSEDESILNIVHTYIAELPPTFPIWEGERQIQEGQICWKQIFWICVINNK